MNIQKFINRTEDLKFLEELYEGKNPEFIIIYGRRRIGKTELIKEFCRNRKHIYYLANKLDDQFQLQEILKRTANLFSERAPKIDNWVEFFEYIKEKASERLIFVIDEFPYLVESNKAIPSLFQAGWDENLKKGKILLILCGSSISMMEKYTLSYKAPIYGRRTGQIRLKPLRFKNACEFFKNADLSRKIEFYSVANGTPSYLIELDPDLDVFTNIEKKILGVKKPLYEEVEFLLKEELRETKNYFAILKAISFGNTRVNDIVTSCNLERNKVARYLDTLIKLDVIKRELPVTEKHPHKSRKGLYRIKDNFFNFWFRFVFPNKSDIEEGNVKNALRIIKNSFNQYVGLSFEDVCREALWELKFRNKIGFDKIGRWWYKDKEIDIVALSEQTREILFTECKWQEKVNAKRVFEELKKKSESVKWNREKRKESYAIFAKSFRKQIKERNLMLFNLRDLERILRQ